MVDYFMIFNFKIRWALIGTWAAIRMNTVQTYLLLELEDKYIYHIMYIIYRSLNLKIVNFNNAFCINCWLEKASIIFEALGYAHVLSMVKCYIT